MQSRPLVFSGAARRPPHHRESTTLSRLVYSSTAPGVGARRQTKDDQDNARCDRVCLFPQSCKTTVSSEWLTLSPSV